MQMKGSDSSNTGSSDTGSSDVESSNTGTARRRFRIVATLIGALGLSLLGGNAAQALAPDKGQAQYQQWMDETAVSVVEDGVVVASYTEREVGQPAFQQMMLDRLTK